MQKKGILTLLTRGPERDMAKPPFHSPSFLANTGIMGFGFWSGLVVLARNHGQLDGIAQFSIYLTLTAMSMLWTASLRAHRRINRLYQEGALDASPGSPLKSALEVGMRAVHMGLLYTVMLVFILLTQMARVLRHT
jgi:hypothetical protein